MSVLSLRVTDDFKRSANLMDTAVSVPSTGIATEKSSTSYTTQYFKDNQSFKSQRSNVSDERSKNEPKELAINKNVKGSGKPWYIISPENNSLLGAFRIIIGLVTFPSVFVNLFL